MLSCAALNKGEQLERVVFDVPAAGVLAAVMQESGRRAGSLAADVRAAAGGLSTSQLGVWFDPDLGAMSSAIAEVEAWAEAAAKDLRWRLDYLHLAAPGFPSPIQALRNDGRVEAFFPLRGAEDVDAWRRGVDLHTALVDALDVRDGATADLLLDDLASLLADPAALAGFASALGATGLGDLVDRIEHAKLTGSRLDSFSEFVGGSNPRWDSLHAELAGLAGAAGGLAAFGAEDPVEVHFVGGGLQIVRMQDLLMTDPLALAFKWSLDEGLLESPLLDMGGVLAAVVPTSHLVSNGQLHVSRVPNTPGNAFYWKDGTGLAAPAWEMPSNWTLVGRSIEAWRKEPGESFQYLLDHPGQVADGFMIGAGMGAAGASLAAGAGLIALTATEVGVVTTGYSLVNITKQAVDPRPCRAERVTLAVGTTMMGGMIGGVFAEEGLEFAAGVVGAGGIFDYGASASC